jgi:hypothetical protein
MQVQNVEILLLMSEMDKIKVEKIENMPQHPVNVSGLAVGCLVSHRLSQCRYGSPRKKNCVSFNLGDTNVGKEHVTSLPGLNTAASISSSASEGINPV